MESSTFHERVKRLKEVNEVIEKLDPAIREGASHSLRATSRQAHKVDGKAPADALRIEGRLWKSR